MSKVHYFDAYGRAEPIRLLLAHVKVPFEDLRYSFEEWPAKKAELKPEFGQVPIYEQDGKQYAQSGSILRFLGRQHGLYSDDAFTAWRIDSVDNSVSDLADQFYKFFFDKDEESKKAGLEKFLKTTLPNWAQAIENRLKNNTSQNYIVGDSLTIADIVLAASASSTFENEASPYHTQLGEVIHQYPTLKAYFDFQRNLFKDYLASRPQPRPF